MTLPQSLHVVWTFRARRRFNQALVRRQVHTGQPIDSEAIMADLDRILALAFPKAKELIVHDQYLGFRFREEEYILLVEVHDDDRRRQRRGLQSRPRPPGRSRQTRRQRQDALQRLLLHEAAPGHPA
jgi:hypothetical protein